MNEYEMRVRAMEDQGMTRSDAQSVVEAEDLKTPPATCLSNLSVSSSKPQGLLVGIATTPPIPQQCIRNPERAMYCWGGKSPRQLKMQAAAETLSLPQEIRYT